MKINLKALIIFTLILFSTYAGKAEEKESAHSSAQKELNVKELILEHVADAYEWHITTIHHHHYSIPLPVILYSKNTGWNCFLSSALHNEDKTYNGFYISQSEKYKGKLVEKSSSGAEIRPVDVSITKNVLSLFISSIVLIFLILHITSSYKRNHLESKKGFIGFMELFIMNINNDVIKPSIGKDYKKFAPYLLTVFFFIFINNLLGLIPIFPGGANVTGNIAITFVLAICTFLLVNFSGSKEYFKEIFWPEVPAWLKVPIPLMPLIEIIGVFTKPFSLMIRLFANILAGHSIVLGLTALIFVTVSLGAIGNGIMTGLSVIFSIFILFVEILVAYIQAYVFTMLSSVYIGMSRIEPHHKEHHAEEHSLT